MKKTRIYAALAATAVAAITASALTAAVSAYSLDDFDLGISWSNSVIIPGEEFADLTADSLITITFETDPFEKEYWCLKPLIDDGGWQYIADYAAAGEDLVAALSEPNRDTFGVEVDMTSVTFKIPAAAIDKVKDTGLILMGHSLILKEMTITNDAPAGGSAGGSAGAGDATTSGDPNKDNADTGVEGVAVVAGAALLAASAVVISRKRK